jgi:hypothetical protein
MPAMQSFNYAPPSNPSNPWELVRTPFGEMEQWRASAMTCGSVGALSDYMRDTISRFDRFRNDSASFVDTLIERERALSAREDVVTKRETVLADLMGRTAQLLDRVERRVGDAEKFDEPIDLPGEASAPGEASDDAASSELPTPTDAHVAQSGELHDVPAKEDPELTADEGFLPEELELQTPTSPAPAARPRGSAFPQPIAVSLNEE